MQLRRHIVPVLACVAGLSVAGLLNPVLVKQRSDYNLQLAGFEGATAELSPAVVFATVALGGFRGLVIDVLWLRLGKLQMEKQEFVEVVQLSDWITKLEPRLAVVWDFHSFNMTYNISVMFPDPVDRWRWVSRGLEMLRDEALVYNPGEVILYDRLCRIYRHKLLDASDPAQPYYRAAWAAEMHELLGGGRPQYESLAADPSATKRMREEYKLDPKLMRELDEQYGPFDWRLPEAHIVYWATRGLQRSASVGNSTFNGLICDAMARAFFGGRITAFDASEGLLKTDVYFEIMPQATTAYEATIEVARDHVLPGHEYEIEGLMDMYSRFLRHALIQVHEHGRTDDVVLLYNKLRDWVQDPETDRPLAEYIEYIKTVDEPADVTPPSIPGHENCGHAHHH